MGKELYVHVGQSSGLALPICRGKRSKESCRHAYEKKNRGSQLLICGRVVPHYMSVLMRAIYVVQSKTTSNNITGLCTDCGASTRGKYYVIALTCRVIPSRTKSSSVSNQVPVALSLISPVWESTAYKGALPRRFSHICDNVTQPPRVLPSSDFRYSRDELDEYRIDTWMLASHSGLRIGSLGDSVSSEVTSFRATMLSNAAFP